MKMRMVYTTLCMVSLLGISGCSDGEAESSANASLGPQTERGGMPSPNAELLKPIHPLAFKDIKCWLSDTEYPVVTQFSITAIEKNENKFNHAGVSVKDDVVAYTDGDSRYWYRHAVKNGVHTIDFYENAGGTLTEHDVIQGRILIKTIVRDGEKVQLEVFDVTGFNPRKDANKEIQGDLD